jgi:hypothetical protein
LVEIKVDRSEKQKRNDGEMEGDQHECTARRVMKGEREGNEAGRVQSKQKNEKRREERERERERRDNQESLSS